MSKKELDNIFQTFFIKTSTAKKEAALACPWSSLLIYLNGKITVESEPGKGTKVVIWLPVSPKIDTAEHDQFTHEIAGAITRHEQDKGASQLLNEYRLKKAVLMLEKDLPVSKVAYYCGYSDPGYFSRVFKKIYQVNPGNYRKQPLKENRATSHHLCRQHCILQ